ncbi:unnamed protein product [Arctogadus glacialis]
MTDHHRHSRELGPGRVSGMGLTGLGTCQVIDGSVVSFCLLLSLHANLPLADVIKPRATQCPGLGLSVAAPQGRGPGALALLRGGLPSREVLREEVVVVAEEEKVVVGVEEEEERVVEEAGMLEKEEAVVVQW